MTFGLLYAFTENFILPISHDEVVHGKGSMLQRMPGNDWRALANLRAYYGFMWGHPGKKLLFMGCEFAQPGEWAQAGELDWAAAQSPEHAGVARLVRDLNTLYRAEPRCTAATARPPASAGCEATTRSTRCPRLAAPRGARATRRWPSSATSPPWSAGTGGRPAAGGSLARGAEQRCGDLRRRRPR
jgi:hypothetical protein